MPVTTSAQTLIERAQKRVTTLSPADVAARRDDDSVLLVDLRDVRERKREGYIPGSMHVPRGMLEFWIDPDSPYHKPAMLEADSLILYCNKGWRSALATATLVDMGLTDVAHMQGGFGLWSEQARDVAHDD